VLQGLETKENWMKKHPNQITQRAPRTLHERDLEAIRGGLDAVATMLMQLQAQNAAIQETIQGVNQAAKAGHDTQQEINRNLK
jgi:ABC-type transporter Mla subunit MlaD